MVTVQEIYDMAICLMDEQSEDDGTTLTEENAEYKFRTIPILNTAIAALSTNASQYFTEPAWQTPRGIGRPKAGRLLMTLNDNGGTDYANPDFTQYIPMDEEFAMAVLPKYLAEQLLSDENPELANFYMGQYREVLQDMKAKIRCSFEPIPTPYGLF